jgi:hypothetical protein
VAFITSYFLVQITRTIFTALRWLSV